MVIDCELFKDCYECRDRCVKCSEKHKEEIEQLKKEKADIYKLLKDKAFKENMSGVIGFCETFDKLIEERDKLLDENKKLKNGNA